MTRPGTGDILRAMTNDARSRADARLEAALGGADHRDPRPFYRHALRYLREHDEDAFGAALRYFEEELVPAVAGEADALAAWAEYGAVLARGMGRGRMVELDTTGRAGGVETALGAEGMVFYVPDDPAAPVLVLRYPRAATPAQHAAYELLVEGRRTASAYG